MKMRNWILLSIMAILIFLIVYCLAKKSNHVPAGYICAVVSFALLILTGWLLLFPKVDEISTTGQYKVAYENTWYTDKNRIETYSDAGNNRELPVAFWYPENSDKEASCPLVIFSHGSFGVKESNLTLYRELASHGYAVISIDHTYQCFSTTMSNGKKIGMSSGFMREIMTDNPRKKPVESFERMKKWMEIRTGDLNFVLDTVIEKVKNKSLELDVYRLIDADKIIATGHSLGGSAALGIGRQRSDVSAVISLEAPYMCDMQGVENGNFIFDRTEYPIPTLNVYSDSLWPRLKDLKQYAQNVKYLDSDSDKFQNAHIEGIGHMSLTDFSLTSPFLTMCIDGKIAKTPPENSLKKLNSLFLDFLQNIEYADRQ